MCQVAARCLLWMLLLGASCAVAQHPVRLDTDEGRQAASMLEHGWDATDKPTLKCEVNHFDWRMEYDLTYSAWYSFALPVPQLDAKAPRVGLVSLRVTPLEPPGAPVYFVRTERLPDATAGGVAPATKISSSGGLAFGAGRYRVDWRFEIADGRNCRDTWTFHTGPPFDGTPRLGVGQVDRLDADGWRSAPAASGVHAPRRATILLHVTTQGSVRNRVRLNGDEIQTLLGALRSMLNSGAFDAARVIAFQYYRASTIFETNTLTTESYTRLQSALTALNVGTIDLSTLQRSNERDDYLFRLLLREGRLTPVADEVFVLGFTRGASSHGSVDWPRGSKLSFPLTYLAITRIGMTPQDAISEMVRKVGGRVVPIYDARQFGKYLATLAAAR